MVLRSGPDPYLFGVVWGFFFSVPGFISSSLAFVLPCHLSSVSSSRSASVSLPGARLPVGSFAALRGGPCCQRGLWFTGRGGQRVLGPEAACCWEGQQGDPASPRRASTAPRFGQVTSDDRDVPALLGASCFLQSCFFLNDPCCNSSPQLLHHPCRKMQEESEHPATLGVRCHIPAAGRGWVSSLGQVCACVSIS